jgi:hypothetical protein
VGGGRSAFAGIPLGYDAFASLEWTKVRFEEAFVPIRIPFLVFSKSKVSQQVPHNQ